MGTTPRLETKTGADCTGTTGGKSRTYTLAYSSPDTNSLSITINGYPLQQTIGYTVSGSVVTFVDELWDDQNIELRYVSTSAVVAGSTYTTATLVEAEILAAASFSTSTTPSLAEVNIWIEEESRQVDRDAGYAFVQTSYTDTINYDGDDILVLKNSPIISVSSLLYSTSLMGTTAYNLASTTTEDTDWTADNSKGTIELLSTKALGIKTGSKMISVAYDAGYTTIPSIIQRLTTKMVAFRVIDAAIKQDVQQRKSGKSISVGSISIVKPSDYGSQKFSLLREDIEGIKKDVTKTFGVHRLGHNV